MKKIWTMVPVALSLSLVACGGGGGTTTTTPQPGSQPSGTTSSVSGILSFPGSQPPVSGAATGQAESQSAEVPALLNLRSWWTSPAEVLARQRHSGIPDSGVIPGEYIVRTRPVGGESTGSTAAPAILRASGLTLRLETDLGLPGLGLYRAEGSSGASPGGTSAQTVSEAAVQGVVQALTAQPGVLSAEPNRWMHALASPNDKLFALQWDAQAMNLPAAWDISKGKAVNVGVIDTGIVKHPDLIASTLPGLDLYSDGSGKSYDLDPTDEGGTSYHGSHVSGTVAAATNNALGVAGVSWGAKIVPVRVLGPDGGRTSDTLLGTLWAIGYDLTKNGLPLNANPARVLNLSLGGSGPCSPAQQEVFDYVAAQGVIAVLAAGNEDQDAANASPANCNNVITVGATGPDGTRAPYSNYGARIDVMAPGGDSSQKIRIGTTELPGGILSTVADENKPGSYGYTALDGTSMAAPHVAGLVAIMKGEQPTLTTSQALARLKATSTPLSAAACRVANGCGAGLVNAAAALKGTATPAPGPTPAPTPTPAPAPTPVASIPTYVVAFYEISPGVYDENLSQIGTLTQKKLREDYKLSGLSAGAYQLAAWQDVDDDKEVDAGEPFGIYLNPVTGKPGVKIDAVSRSIIGIDMQLRPITTQAVSNTVSAADLVALKREAGRQAKRLSPTR